MSEIFPTTPELLSIEQFAQKLDISRATVFKWMNRGVLIQGRHFFRYGRVVRFAWSQELVEALLGGSVEERAVQGGQHTVTARKKSTSINWEY